jgi:tetraacyldisaccharide 4'-kinase
LQSPNRSEVAQIAVEELEMQVLLLDDGFQHRRLQRDLDIVLLDATNPFGWGYTLPRGLLREPLAALRRADLVMVTRCDLIPPQELTAIRTKVQRIHPKAAWVESVHRPIGWKNSNGEHLDLNAFKGKEVVALCAIGNPSAFHQTLEKMGLQIAERITYPDHHPYNAEDIEQIVAQAHRRNASVAIVCPGKDLAKLASNTLGGIPLWALQVELQIVSGEAVLGDYLDRIYQAAIGNHATEISLRDNLE